MASILKTEMKQKNQIKKLKAREHWMKWLIGVALIAILLLLLLLGYATDWTRGLRKDDTITPTDLTSSLDSLDGASAADGASGGTDGGATSSGQNTSNAIRETTNQNSTTEKTTTTTNNTTTPSAPPSSNLLSLYNDTGAGDNINEVIDRAEGLGVGVICEDQLLIQVCTFSQDGNSFVTKNLLGSDTVTSILDNF